MSQIPSKLVIDKAQLEDLLKGRFFYDRSFSIYGGTAGLYDFGPPGCAVKNNLLAFWRRFFVLEENMLEIDGSCVASSQVFEASGHVDKFVDLMVRDVVTKDYFRADHLIRDFIEKLLENKDLTEEKRKELNSVLLRVEKFEKDEINETLKKYEVKSPNGNEVSESFPFNLMFSTTIGPGNATPGFLRPELAQGIFLNFPRLLEANAGKIPFAAAQIGQAFRNEIAPRSGLLRVREFTLAEIEHFVKKEEKTHSKFPSVKDLKPNLYPRTQQNVEGHLITDLTLEDTLKQNVIGSEIIAYYVGRTYLFLTSCGIQNQNLRFRQHLEKEMAHYANDCWDAEILTTHGWIECVGIADRGCYDLTKHSKNARLSVYENFPEPKLMQVVQFKPNKSVLGKKFQKAASPIIKHLEALNEKQEGDEMSKLQQEFDTHKKIEVTVSGVNYELDDKMITFEKKEKKISGHTFIPHTIEPSFGIGRIIYCIFENTFRFRDNKRILSLPAHLAPVKCSVLPLMPKPELTAFVDRIVSNLTKAGLSSKVDTAQSIGRRYARTDEIGIPFGITIDYETIKDDTVTLRNRDKTSQIRVKIDELSELVNTLLSDKISWDDVEEKYPKV